MGRNKPEDLTLRGCKPFLGLFGVGSRPLYRGMDEEYQGIKALDFRRNHAPRRISESIYDAVDAWFCDQVGFRNSSSGVL